MSGRLTPAAFDIEAVGEQVRQQPELRAAIFWNTPHTRGVFGVGSPFFWFAEQLADPCFVSRYLDGAFG